MDADELLLRERLHRAYDAAAPRAVLVPSRVLDQVHARVALAAHRRRVGVGLALGAAGLAAVSAIGVQVTPRSVQLAPGSPGLAQRGTGGSGATSGGPGQGTLANGAAAGITQPPLPQCSARDLKVTVSTDQNSYTANDAVEVRATITNTGRASCAYAPTPAVWVSDAGGRRWQLCPEPSTPPPSPGVYADTAIGPAVGSPSLRPGRSDWWSCEWHPAFTKAPPGVYTAHATWGPGSATAYFTVVAATATPTPSPAATATPSPTPTPTPPLLPLP